MFLTNFSKSTKTLYINLNVSMFIGLVTKMNSSDHEFEPPESIKKNVTTCKIFIF